MTPRQFEIWKCKPEGFQKSHWFVIISGNEHCLSDRQTAVNGLACFTLRGDQMKTDVRLNGADGFEHPTVCACNFLYYLPKIALSDRIGPVTIERQQQIKTRIREVFRLG
jgi:hypothetical protein